MNFLLAAANRPFIPSWDALGGLQLRPFAAELVLVGTILAVLLAALVSAKRSNTISALITLCGLLAALGSVLLVRNSPAGPQFAGMLVSDSVAVMWKSMLLLFVCGIVLMWFATTSSTMHEGDGPEFFTLLLGATLGMCLMGSTANLLMIFMAVELASLPSYVLAGFRKTDRLGSEASLKYVLFGAATSSVMVYGMSWLYGMCGTLQLNELAAGFVMASDVPMIVALVGLLAGIGFKISAVPFHFWCPDVFEGAGVDVSAFLSVASKGAGLVLLLRVLMTLADGAQFSSAVPLLAGTAVAVGILGAITATVGNTGAYVQKNIKRLLAYSSIAHAGYMLCALSLLVRGRWTPTGMNLADSAAQAILLYLAVYLFMNLGAFTVAGLVYRQSGSESIEDYAGLGRRSPVLAVCMTAFMFSLVGLPPFAGFAAKLNIMYVLGYGGGWWWALVGIIGLNTIFSLYYYVRVIRMMYLVESDKPAFAPNPLGMAMSVVCAVMLLVMLVGFSPLQKMAANYGHLYMQSPPVHQALAERDR